MHKIFQLVAVFFLLMPTVEAKELIPMGETVEIELEMPHFIVVQDVYLDSGQWLRKLDEIIKVNDEPLTKLEKLPTTDSQMTIRRQHKEQQLSISAQEISKLSQFVKNTTTGIGTLTYIDPNTKQFGALGHQIIDQTLSSAPTIYKGALYMAYVENIKKSEPGVPGYKIAQNRQTLAIGEVVSNEVYGIFGKWQQPLQQSLPEAREIMQAKDIQLGPAILQTTISGQDVEDFSIEITEIEGETFKFSVKDTKLIAATGGIVQGMSGSPIIQNEQFIGAVTHMFVEEPTKGAAIAIVEMIKKSPY